MYKLLFILGLCTLPIIINAQEEPEEPAESPFSYNVDLVSRYVWRGLMLNENPNIQPYAAYTKGNFSIGAWGSYGVSDIYGEVDFYASYTIKGITLTLSDYYCMDGSQNYRFFDYGDKTTNHALEGAVSFTISEKFPLSLTAATFFYGNDKDSTGSNYYSTYFELAYPFACKGYDFTVFVGGTPSESFYSTAANIVNLGFTFTRQVTITDKITLPVSASIVTNPNSESIFFVAKITF